MKRRSALCIDLAALAAEGAPEWVQLFPAVPKVEGRAGRSWTMHSPEAVVALSLADRDRLPLDEDHYNSPALLDRRFLLVKCNPAALGL